MACDFSALQNRVNGAIGRVLHTDPAKLNGVDVTGRFDNGFDEQALAMGLAASAPVFTLASSAVPALVGGMTLVIGSVTYKVVESMPDGTGITRLQLRT